MKCPVCEGGSLNQLSGTYKTEYTSRDGTVQPLLVPNLAWHECDSCGEAILDEPASLAVEAARRRALGLLSPPEIRNIRTSLNLTQSEISRLLGIGEKTYCRWESGAYVQSLAFDRYLRLLVLEPANLILLAQMESGAEMFSRAGLPLESGTSVSGEGLFSDLQFRESLADAAKIFTYLLTRGELYSFDPRDSMEVN